MKKIFSFNFFVSALLTVVAFLLAGGNSVMMAAATANLDAGTTSDGTQEYAGVGQSDSGLHNPTTSTTTTANKNGIATETTGRANGDEDFYLNDIDKKIVRIRPMSTPIDQISRYASSSHTDSFECKYYSVGTRAIKTLVATGGITAMTSGDQSTVLNAVDTSLFTIDDTIRVVGVKASYDYKGNAYSSTDKRTPDLVLVVCGKDSNSKPIVYCQNGSLNSDGQPTLLSTAIPANTVLIRMGKAGGEVDMQTGRFANLPTADIQYCQNFMTQVEQSTFDKIAAKEVNWGFSDLEEDSLYDMRLTQEESFLFGDQGMIKHTSKDGMAQWFCKGIWWMAGKDVTIGHYDTDKSEAVISDEDLIDMAKDLFVGAGTGNKKKVILCGSDVLAAFGKIQSDKFRLVSTYEKWHLKFTQWETGFGTLNVIHHELFDLNGMSDCAFALDPEYLHKRVHLNWTRNVLDLQKAGVRNTDAVVLQEVSCLYLRYPNAHARMQLATNA